jgi:hypothetical protein
MNPVDYLCQSFAWTQLAPPHLRALSSPTGSGQTMDTTLSQLLLVAALLAVVVLCSKA